MIRMSRRAGSKGVEGAALAAMMPARRSDPIAGKPAPTSGRFIGRKLPFGTALRQVERLIRQFRGLLAALAIAGSSRARADGALAVNDGDIWRLLIWVGTVLFVLWLFKEPIAGLIGRVKRVDLRNGDASISVELLEIERALSEGEASVRHAPVPNDEGGGELQSSPEVLRGRTEDAWRSMESALVAALGTPSDHRDLAVTLRKNGFAPYFIAAYRRLKRIHERTLNASVTADEVVIFEMTVERMIANIGIAQGGE